MPVSSRQIWHNIPMQNPLVEMQRYLAELHIPRSDDRLQHWETHETPRSDDLLQYWETHETLHPDLHVPAQTFCLRQHHLLHASSCFYGRRGFLLSQKRNRLSPKMVELTLLSSVQSNNPFQPTLSSPHHRPLYQSHKHWPAVPKHLHCPLFYKTLCFYVYFPS